MNLDMSVSVEPEVMLLCLSLIVMFGFAVYILQKYVRLLAYVKLQATMCERITDSCAALSSTESIPVLAVERFMTYVNHPDPAFDPAFIAKQEAINQLSHIGPAKE